LGVQRLLDVGCGCGDFGRGLKASGLREVHGIEVVEPACRMARQVLDGAVLGDIEQLDLPFQDGYFDCITFADVLEHLKDPTAVLRKVDRVLAPDGVILMSIPNVRFYEVIHMLVNGRWQYADAGILDRTHLRFFTVTEMINMVRDAGLEVLHVQALSYAPEDRVPRNPDGSLSLGRAKIWAVDAADYHDLLTYQYLLMAGKPNADRLTKARDALLMKRNEAALVLAEQAKGVDECERKKIMAAAAARVGQLANAEKWYREALAGRPEDPALAGEFGILLVATNRPADAKSYLERAIAADPHHDRAIGALGLVYMAEGRYGEAMDCFTMALDACYDHTALVPHLIQAAEKLGRFDAIEGLVRRYADFYPANTDLAYAHAALLAQLHRWPDARDRLATLLLFDPAHEAARRLRQTIPVED
jgi:SAM-dependent methyltransferase/Tfp pilus assembly protein PilF